MEVTCDRCHQVLPERGCFCPTCGLPHLVYTTEEAAVQDAAERQTTAQRDASSVDWKAAARYALTFGIPAGLFCNGVSGAGLVGSFCMAAAAAWAVSLYVRRQRPLMLTIGAGARIGLVTGMLAAWLAFAVAGGVLFAERYGLHRGNEVDTEWQNRVAMTQQFSTQLAAQVGVADQAQMDAQKKLMLSPWGHAGFEVFSFAFNSLFLLVFATAGGAAGAYMMARRSKVSI